MVPEEHGDYSLTIVITADTHSLTQCLAHCGTPIRLMIYSNNKPMRTQFLSAVRMSDTVLSTLQSLLL